VGNPKNIYARLHAQHPTVSVKDIKEVLEQVQSQSRVPAGIHDIMLKNVGESMNVIVQRVSEAITTVPGEGVDKMVHRWMRLCILPHLLSEGPSCSPDALNMFWVLHPSRVSEVVDGMIRDLNEKNPQVGLEIARMLRRNIRADIRSIAQTAHVNPEYVSHLRRTMMEIFSQPAWFLDVVFSFKGDMSPLNRELLEAVESEASEKGSKVNGNLIATLQAWIRAVVIPIRAGNVKPLPYVRMYPLVNGQEQELVVVRPEIIQQYLNSLLI
jgi:hypothetical protein